MAALAGWPTDAAAQTTMTMSSWVPPSHLLTKTSWGVGAAGREGYGRPRSSRCCPRPVGAPGTFDAVKDGLVDVSYVTASYTPARHVLPLLPELPAAAPRPRSIPSPTRASTGSTEQVGGTRASSCWVFTHGPGQMFNTKRAITS
jgi:hypothetical protein